MWQALADPDGTYLWAAPSDGENVFGDADRAARYEPAVQLLKYSLGWSEPAAGLRWWYDRGRPLDDPRFALLDAMLGDEMDLLAAWYWTNTSYGAQRVAVDRAWLAAVQSRPNWQDWAGHGDSLHLEFHATFVEQELGTGGEWFADVQHGRAYLIVDQYAGWYARLQRYWAELPARPPGDPWWVDVFCRPVGYLGTYRRSRTTGRCYAGPFSCHGPGCPGAAPPDEDDDDSEIYLGLADDDE